MVGCFAGIARPGKCNDGRWAAAQVGRTGAVKSLSRSDCGHSTCRDSRPNSDYKSEGRHYKAVTPALAPPG